MSYSYLTKEQLDFVLARTSPHSFKHNIERMNAMYKLPINTEPTLHGLHKPNGDFELPSTRLKGFLKTIRDEAEEGDTDKGGIVGEGGILKKLLALEYEADQGHQIHDTEEYKDALVDLADWLGDMMVFIRSEAMKYGLPLEECLEAINGSNMTKLGSDGIPKHDENGKFLKDMDSFIPPEPAIKSVLFGLILPSDAQ